MTLEELAKVESYIVIVGGSCTGKDYLANKLVELGRIKANDVTTRVLRPGEERKSVSMEEFEKCKEGYAVWTYINGVGYANEGNGNLAILNDEVVDEFERVVGDVCVVRCKSAWETRVDRKMKRDEVGRYVAEFELKERDKYGVLVDEQVVVWS